MELYERIKFRRNELDMSQDELAQKLGYKSRSTIAKIENGENDIPQSKIEAFAKALQTTPSYLMGWEDKPNKQSDLPPLTAKDEREIARDLEAMINALDSRSGMAAYNDPEDAEDAELLKASLLTSMRLAKQMAKKKFTPHKYRKE
ncbi:Helix-turn-helix [Desulfitobacterium hafniense]|uniref:Helix-turn-helix n=1 Tax=Desulfitobacterium hafniense TaxID=49338 RepID=A0A098AX86_DESHA|nr:helix-turn-helix transcriptional regulator [Desulfitobacterium hafniense]CDX00732.1 Helix-turn-helix [Desulfitobacterium hafniense]